MKTIQELEEELIGLEKCIQFETERKALKWYLISYVEVWFELRDSYEATFWQLN